MAVPVRRRAPLTTEAGYHGDLRASVLAALPVVTVDEATATTGDSCPICLEIYHLGQETHALPCGHTYHRPCIRTWFAKQSTCPVCRDSLLANVQNPIMMGTQGFLPTREWQQVVRSAARGGEQARPAFELEGGDRRRQPRPGGEIGQTAGLITSRAMLRLL